MPHQFLYLEPYLSRRLGLSLGVDLLGGSKQCTFNCVYCEIGPTNPSELKPITYRYQPEMAADQFLNEIEHVLSEYPGIDSITFGYFGEPTLAYHLPTYLSLARELQKKYLRDDGGPKLSIFTNSSLINDPTVRSTLVKFDQIIAKLDSATQIPFDHGNCPHFSVPKIEQIIRGLCDLRSELKVFPNHQLILQTLLYKSSLNEIISNYSEENLRALLQAYLQIAPHMIHIYSVARPPAIEGIHNIGFDDKQKVTEFFRKNLPLSIPFRVF